jgi:hypothetical protein
VFFSNSLWASVAVPVHSHKFYSEGVLPEPYVTYSLNIELDVETYDVRIIELQRGHENISIPNDIINQLKNIDLSTIQITHEMHRSPERPAYSKHGDEGDWLHISVELGKMYRAEKEEKGIGYFKWGKDKVEITIIKNKRVTIRYLPLNKTYEFWSRKT